MPLDHEKSEALRGELRAVVAEHGPARFAKGRLLEPTPESFPDAWAGDEASAKALAGRVLDHAGLGDLVVTVGPYRSPQTKEQQRAMKGDAIRQLDDPIGPATVLAHDGVRCEIGIDPFGLRHPDMLASALCRVAAVLFEERARSHYRDPAVAADYDAATLRRAEVTSIYLGYGLLTTNDTHVVYRESTGRRKGTQVFRTAGQLGLEEMSWLLAHELALRSLGWWERRRVLGLLGPSQGDLVRGHLKTMDRAAVASVLGAQ